MAAISEHATPGPGGGTGSIESGLDVGVLGAVFEAATEGILIADDERRYVAANPAACEILGRPLREVLTIRIDDLAIPEAKEWVDAAWAQFLAEGTQSGPMEIARPDGTIRHVDYNARARIAPGYHLSLLHDVTRHVLAERELRQRLETTTAMREAFEALADSVVMLEAVRDAEGAIVDETIVFTNSVWRQEILGSAEAPDPVGERLLERFPHFADRLELHRRVIETGEPYRAVMAMPGGERMFDTEYVKFGDGVIALSRDVSPQVAAERALARSEERFRAVSDANPEALGVFRPVFDKDGRFVDAETLYVNEVVRSSYYQHLAPGEIVGRCVFELAPAFRDSLFGAYAQVAERREELRLEVHGIRASGEFWSDITLFPFEEGFVHLGRDITDAKKAELALAARTAELEEAQQLAHVGSWTRISATGAERWSDELYAIYGLEPGSAPPGPDELSRLVGAEGLREITARAAAVLETGEPTTLEYDIHRADGSVRHVSGRSESIRDGSGAIVGIRGTVVDITEHHILTESMARAARLESLGRLASGVAHDVNNLLYGVELLGGAIARHPDSPNVAQDARQILEAAGAGKEMTRALLAFARGGSSERRTVEPGSFVRDSVELIERLLGPAVTVRTEFAPGLPLVEVDPAGLNQALINLSVNARDAMPDGGRLSISVDTATLDAAGALAAGTAPGRHVRISVADTGIGIPASQIGRIFEPFYTTKPADIGTGLGLAVTYGFVQANAGGITVESEVGAGSTFRIYLPARDGQPETPSRSAGPRPATPPRPAG